MCLFYFWKNDRFFYDTICRVVEQESKSPFSLENLAISPFSHQNFAFSPFSHRFFILPSSQTPVLFFIRFLSNIQLKIQVLFSEIHSYKPSMKFCKDCFALPNSVRGHPLLPIYRTLTTFNPILTRGVFGPPPKLF